MARQRNKVTLNPVLFIACEGTRTEFDYFTSWSQTESARTHFSAINIYPSDTEENPKNNPQQLVDIAKSTLGNGEANLAWVVFDKDGHPFLQAAMNDAQKNKIKVAFSSRSFEEWVLMHFEKNQNAFDATECKDGNKKPINCGTPTCLSCAPVVCLSGHLRRNGYLNDYSKKKKFDLFGHINNKTETALINAPWLRYKCDADTHIAKNALHKLNPYTDVDKLVLSIQGRTDKVIWGGSSSDVTLDIWSLNTRITESNLTIQLSHTHNRSQVINNLFINSAFFTTDDELTDLPCTFIEARIITGVHGSTQNSLMPEDKMELNFSYTGHPYFLFHDRSRNLRIYIEL
jgi:hypothetical protein